ncbi:hypothetical protein LTR66_001969 [Elasticomyces elasticus]|nr:hypothetical protein LTR66_001969 [Elasticomyces elasticus]
MQPHSPADPLSPQSPPSNLTRKRSISFTPPRRLSPPRQRQPDSPSLSAGAGTARWSEEVTESSADEQTAIFRRQGVREAGAAARYGAVDGAVEEENGAAGAGVEAEAEAGAGAEQGTTRRRTGRRRSSAVNSTRGRRTSQTSFRRGRAGQGGGQVDGGGDGGGGGVESGGEEREAWWKVLVEKYGSVELENRGSVARDHLALERTFLAWIRTSLSFASIGIAVTQLFRLNTSLQTGEGSSVPTADMARLRHIGKPLGATFLCISILVLFLGFHRYFESQHYVIRGKFPASRGTIVLVTLVAGALIVSSLVVVLVVAPGAFEKR